nr:transposase (putative), gypsy type [Tanacetum cinerariifolium]
MHERPAGKIRLYTRDPTPIAADFNAQDYSTLVAHPSPFRKFLEEFLCLVRLSRHYTLNEKTYPLFLDKDGEDMDIFAFVHTPDPTKVKVVEQERKDDKPRLLETTVDHTVPLLPVAPDRGEIELDSSVDKLFDEGGSGTQTKQEDSASGEGGQGINIQPVTETTDTVAEDNAEVRGEPISTLPFVTLFVSATPERKGEDSYHHSGANIAKAEVDSFAKPSIPVITAATFVTSTVDPAVVVKGKIVKPYLFFADSTLTGGTDPAMGGFTDLAGSDFLIGGIRTMVDEFAPNKFFASVRRMEHDQLFTEFNVGAAHQMSLSVEVRMRAEYNIREKRRLESVVEEKNQLLKARDEEINNLKAQMLLKEAKAAKRFVSVLKLPIFVFIM